MHNRSVTAVAILLGAALLWCVVVFIPSVIVQSARELVESFSKPSNYEMHPSIDSIYKAYREEREAYDEEEEEYDDDDYIDIYDDDPANW